MTELAFFFNSETIYFVKKTSFKSAGSFQNHSYFSLSAATVF